MQRLVFSGTHSLLAECFLMVPFSESQQSGAFLLLLVSAFLKLRDVQTQPLPLSLIAANSFPTLFWFSQQIT